MTSEGSLRQAMAAQITIIGTYHMANPGLDLVKTSIRDTLSADRQAEITLLTSRLAQFEPTKIAVEALPDGRINDRYATYLAGRLQLSANEVEQVGFRLGEILSHREVFGIDYHSDMDFEKLTRFAEKEKLEWFLDLITNLQQTAGRRMEEMDRRFTVSQILSIYNSPSFLSFSHSVYLEMLRLNSGDRYPGVDVVAEWYRRNMVIYANLRRLVQSPSDRILVLFGAGHAKILRDFVKDAPDLEWVDPLDFLPGVPDSSF